VQKRSLGGGGGTWSGPWVMAVGPSCRGPAGQRVQALLRAVPVPVEDRRVETLKWARLAETLLGASAVGEGARP